MRSTHLDLKSMLMMMKLHAELEALGLARDFDGSVNTLTLIGTIVCQTHCLSRAREIWGPLSRAAPGPKLHSPTLDKQLAQQLGLVPGEGGEPGEELPLWLPGY